MYDERQSTFSEDSYKKSVDRLTSKLPPEKRWLPEPGQYFAKVVGLPRPRDIERGKTKIAVRLWNEAVSKYSSPIVLLEPGHPELALDTIIEIELEDMAPSGTVGFGKFLKMGKQPE